MSIMSCCIYIWKLYTQQTQDVSKTFYNGFEMVLYLKYVFQRSLKRCNKTFLAKRFINVLKIGFEDVFIC